MAIYGSNPSSCIVKIHSYDLLVHHKINLVKCEQYLKIEYNMLKKNREVLSYS